MNQKTPPFVPGQMLYGAKAMAEFLGITTRQVFHLTERGRLPHFRVGRTLCGNRSTLAEWAVQVEAGAPAETAPAQPAE
ncbi:DNA-binding protein [Methylobacterium sp. J-090]|uniref:DNA-binding protein n=1 Tax=Methylobacterium sp. J-090 TaxID=2836666 RepID=UPI001FB89B01|nr:DNA-binding protein [Methylobacterium sp. J-090]MCJ2080173.1 DNA-binding protein [Methylobacterium sp. J-090]